MARTVGQSTGHLAKRDTELWAVWLDKKPRVQLSNNIRVRMVFYTGLAGPSNSLGFRDDSYLSFVDEEQKQRSKANDLNHRSGTCS